MPHPAVSPLSLLRLALVKSAIGSCSTNGAYTQTPTYTHTQMHALKHTAVVHTQTHTGTDTHRHTNVISCLLSLALPMKSKVVAEKVTGASDAV